MAQHEATIAHERWTTTKPGDLRMEVDKVYTVSFKEVPVITSDGIRMKLVPDKTVQLVGGQNANETI